jgi:hypothetical protein
LWSYVGRTPLVWAGAQLALGLCLAFVSFARRRGPIRPRRDEPRTSPIEFIETMGALYERGREAGPAVSTARGRVRRLLAGRSGLSAAASDDRLAAAAQRYGLDRAGVESLLDRARLAAEDPATSERDAVALVRELQALGRTIEGNRRPSAARQRTPGQTAGETRG